MVAKSFLEHHFVPVSAGLFADNRLLVSLRGELSLKLLVVSLGSFVVRFKLQDLFDLLEPLCQIIHVDVRTGFGDACVSEVRVKLQGEVEALNSSRVLCILHALESKIEMLVSP